MAEVLVRVETAGADVSPGISPPSSEEDRFRDRLPAPRTWKCVPVDAAASGFAAVMVTKLVISFLLCSWISCVITTREFLF